MLNYTNRLANRVAALRSEHNLSLDQLAKKSGLSRTSLSRLENAEVSPTAETLGKLCAAFGLPVSRLLMMVEDDFTAHVPFEDQPEWEDPETGFTRRSVSPPTTQLSAEVLEGHIPPGTTISYDAPPRPGLEHHLVLLDGALSLRVDGTEHHLTAGDCLRYQLHADSRFATPEGRGARYILVLV